MRGSRIRHLYPILSPHPPLSRREREFFNSLLGRRLHGSRRYSNARSNCRGAGVRGQGRMKSLARSLRSRMTDAERILWYHLRARRLAGFKFRRQLVIEPYIVDFACIEAKLIVEADGGQHGEQENADAERTAFLNRSGYRVLRFWNHEILTDTDAVLERIHSALIESPHPTASPGAKRDSSSCQRVCAMDGAHQPSPGGRGA